MNASWLLFLLGTLMGITYWGLGVAASSHFKDKGVSGPDRFFSSSMLWSLADGRYDDQGRKLCTRANIVLVIAVAAWIGWAKLHY